LVGYRHCFNPVGELIKCDQQVGMSTS
jgi:hypothetical protein